MLKEDDIKDDNNEVATYIDIKLFINKKKKK